MMVQIGILGYVGSILLTFLTLPVEFNASKRACVSSTSST